MSKEEQLQLLVSHFRKRFKNHYAKQIHILDAEDIKNLICPYCSHDCAMCHTLKQDHVRNCIYDTVINGLEKHLGSKSCYISDSEIKSLDSIYVRYKAIKSLKSKQERHQEMDQLIRIVETENQQHGHLLSNYINKIPELELSHKFDLLMETVLETNHLLYDEHDLQNIEENKFHELCKHCYDARAR